ncbi:MAG: hypothetical protein A2428_06920 [Bdellovibrionales bacterium RIFOXYC1_FULL_54_43]|nr:MAG: hypothetical protein A2428_06920 [Bdellovibrionales bacterium RIFOXYC1_FULL_54_43]
MLPGFETQIRSKKEECLPTKTQCLWAMTLFLFKRPVTSRNYDRITDKITHCLSQDERQGIVTFLQFRPLFSESLREKSRPYL